MFSASAVIKDLPLKEMDGSLLALALMREHPTEQMRVAIEVSALIHRGHVRANRGIMPKDHYITHPLRNTLRLVRWGITDEATLIASVLHDTVEDGSRELLERSGLVVPEREGQAADKVLQEVITPLFGDEVREILRAVTNPEMDKALSKSERNELYRIHVRETLQESGKAALVKLSDLVDNAGSLHHNTDAEGLVSSRASKYLPLMDDLLESVYKQTLLSPVAKEDVIDQVKRMKIRLEGFIREGVK